MIIKRRGFFKKSGWLASVTGLGRALPILAFAESTAKKKKNNNIIASTNNAVTDTTTGKVRGYARIDIFTFKSIPYGAPTDGKNRFMPLQMPVSWKGVHDCLVYGPICPQKANNGWLQEEYAFLYQWIDGYLDEESLKKKIIDKFGSKGDNIYKVLRKTHANVKPVEILSFISAQNPIAFLLASLKTAQKTDPVYLYIFAWQTPMLDGRPCSFHCSAIPFAFANTDRYENYAVASEEARKLDDKVAKCWINFVVFGNHNHKGLSEWQAFN